MRGKENKKQYDMIKEHSPVNVYLWFYF